MCSRCAHSVYACRYTIRESTCVSRSLGVKLFFRPLVCLTPSASSCSVYVVNESPQGRDYDVEMALLGLGGYHIVHNSRDAAYPNEPFMEFMSVPIVPNTTKPTMKP
jgi:hypothetical protein